MQSTAPRTKSIPVAELRDHATDLVEEIARGGPRIALEALDGTPLAAVVSVGDLNRLRRLDEQDQEAWRVLEAMRAPFRGVPLEEIEEETEKALAELRAERRAERARVASAEPAK